MLQLDLGLQSDTVIITGNMTLDGTLQLSGSSVPAPGTYRVVTCGGTLTNNGLAIGTLPAGVGASVAATANSVDIIITPAIVTGTTGDSLVIAGQAARFIVATIAGTLTYKWLKYSPAGAVDSVGNDDTLTLASVSTAENGSQFRCVVTGNSVTDTSRALRLRVIGLLNITRQPTDTLVDAGDTAAFSCLLADTATATYEWRRAGNATILGTAASLMLPAVVYDDSGSGYYCRITSLAGTITTDTARLGVRPDSSTVSRMAFNPLRLTARTLSGKSVVIILDSVHLVDTSAPAPVCDSIGIWYKAGALPQNSIDGTVIATYPRSAFKGTTIIDTITLPADDSVVGLMSGLYWPNGTFSTFSANNGVLLFPADTTPPVNNLLPTVSVKNGDSILVALTITPPPDTLKIGSLALWYGIDSQTVASTVAGATARWVSASALSPISKPVVLLTDTLFAGVHERIYLGVALKSTNGKLGKAAYCSFGTKKWLTSNPFTLRASAASPTSVRLSWTNNTSSSHAFDTIRIWYGTDVILQGAFINNHRFDSVTVALNDTAKTLSGLTPATTYYFAIHGKNDGFWSDMSAPAIYSCTTPALTSDTLKNPVIINAIRFDSLTATIRIRWCIDSTVQSIDGTVGITCGIDQYPTSFANASLVELAGRCTDSTVPIPGTIRFDTTYFVGLWYQSKEGTWIKPDDRSRSIVTIGRPFRQLVTFFDTAAVRDTVEIFNGSVVLLKDSTYSEKTIISDTIELLPTDGLATGLVAIGPSIIFRKAGPVIPFRVGFRIDSVPPGFSIADVRIYHDSAGVLTVDYDTELDATQEYVYVKTASLRRTFVAAIDTVVPRVSVYSDTAGAVTSTQKLKDSLQVMDNIANVRLAYYYSRGDEAPVLRSTTVLRAAGSPVSLVISDSARVISSESGLRAFLVITDGVHIDTVNLSRRVVRYESDMGTTEAGIWTPIYPTAELSHTETAPILSRLLPAGASAGYDPRYLRLFRWFDYDKNRTSPDKWVEYDTTDREKQKIFSFIPGRLVWLKSLENVPYNLDTGVTLSLKDTFEYELPSHQWSDFGMPFRFGVRLEEILSATGTMGDSVQYYVWSRDSIDDIYRLMPLHVPGMPDKMDWKRTVSYLPQGGYSFYNTAGTTVRLRIPPVLPSMAIKGASKEKSARSNAWSIKFIATEERGAALPAVYCGFAPNIKKGMYPVPPAYSTLQAWVFDRSTQTACGHGIDEDAANGFTREIRIANRGETVRIVDYRLERVGNLPDGFDAYCYDAKSGAMDTVGRIVVEGNATVSRWIISGDAAYRERFIQGTSGRFLLANLYPNPARSQVTIRYTVPFGTEERLKLMVFDMLGKRVWERNLDGPLAAGQHTLTWNGNDRTGKPAGSGMYIVQLVVIDKRDKPVGRFEQRVTLLR
jgi:hypothetical protein